MARFSRLETDNGAGFQLAVFQPKKITEGNHSRLETGSTLEKRWRI
jgi:hypothetical protein